MRRPSGRAHEGRLQHWARFLRDRPGSALIVVVLVQSKIFFGAKFCIRLFDINLEVNKDNDCCNDYRYTGEHESQHVRAPGTLCQRRCIEFCSGQQPAAECGTDTATHLHTKGGTNEIYKEKTKVYNSRYLDAVHKFFFGKIFEKYGNCVHCQTDYRKDNCCCFPACSSSPEFFNHYQGVVRDQHIARRSANEAERTHLDTLIAVFGDQRSKGRICNVIGCIEYCV